MVPPPERWRRRAAVLGVNAEPGESFECVIPEHQHAAKIERADGKWRYRCRREWSFAEVFASVTTGTEQTLGAGPLTSRWFDLLSHEAGLLQPTPVQVTAPRRCGDTTAHVAERIALFLGLRDAGGGHGPHEPFTFARDFVMAYCGIGTMQARRAMGALEAGGSIVRAGDVAVWGPPGRKAILWRLP
jgi:hypothetical protein